MSTPELDIARRIFTGIKQRFSHLTMSIDENHPYVDIALEIPRQAGLAFEMHLNLQNKDELHITTPTFWCAWFPCTEPVKTETYLNAVVGLIEGQYRILEHLRGARVVKAELQRPSQGTWETIGACRSLAFPWPRPHTRVVQNNAAA